jgi:hypothetical protein
MPDYKVQLKDGFTFHTPDPNLLLAQEGKPNAEDIPSFFTAMPDVATVTDVDTNQIFTNPTVEEDDTPTPAPVVDPSVAIIASLKAGNVISDAELLKIADSNVRSQAATQLAKNIVTQGGSTQDVNDRIRGLFGTYFDTPDSGGYGTWAESVGFTFTTPDSDSTATAETTADSGGSVPIGYTKGADSADIFGAAGDIGGNGATKVPAGLESVFTADEWNSLNADQKADFIRRFGTDASAFTGSDVVPTPAGPATMDIFGNMQTQEAFQDDVFRRFLTEQVSPSGDPRTLSPFMMRGAQSMRPQLLAEYNQSIFDPNMWSPEGPTTTFADWLRAGERPTRQGLFDTLGDIGSIVSGGDQALIAPGLSLNERLRRADIQSRFGTDTAESRKALQGLFSTAALSGVAPAFRYPIQSAAQNLFQTQRALQPEQSFLSFLGNRLNPIPDSLNPNTPTPSASFWTTPEGMKRQAIDLDIGI